MIGTTKKNIVFINTATRENSYVTIVTPSISRTQVITERNVLTALDILVKKVNVSLKHLDGIVVVQGPGQFSSIRTGIAVANTLGYALNIPVAGIALDNVLSQEEILARGIKKIMKVKNYRPVAPVYGAEPNITKAKTKV